MALVQTLKLNPQVLLRQQEESRCSIPGRCQVSQMVVTESLFRQLVRLVRKPLALSWNK
jgi:hypothetical protein